MLVLSKATCAAPLREVLTPYRGRWPHHARKDRVGTWEIPRSTGAAQPPRSASGRRGAVADDARTREVSPRRTSCEADEQGRATGHGAGGAKGGDQGECGPAKRAPGTGPGKCVKCAGPHTTSVSSFSKRRSTNLRRMPHPERTG